MAKKKLIEIHKDKPEVPVSKEDAKKEFAATIELYKTQNPAKYELNKAALEKQLSNL